MHKLMNTFSRLNRQSTIIFSSKSPINPQLLVVLFLSATSAARPSIFIFISNKMNTLSEDQYIRAEKLKKQQLYRNMLDQQVRLNEHKRDNEVHNLRHPLNDGRYAPHPRSSVQYPHEEPKYLPPLAHQSPKENNWNPNRNPYGRSNTEEDKTELYLNNCEEIIRNLRELKGKKKQWENYGSQPEYHAKKEIQKQKYQQVQYYPKPNYFSSSGSAYNKSVGIQPSGRQFRAHSNRLNTLDDPRQSNDKYIKRQSAPKNPKNKKYLDKIVHPTAETEEISHSKSKQSDKQESPQSQSPWGIKEQARVPKKQSKVRHKLFKLTTPKRDEDGRVGVEPSQSQQNQEGRQHQKKNDSQLTACLVQLTKYLKNLNEKQERDRQRPKQQTGRKPQTAQIQQRQSQLENQDENMSDKQKSPQEEQLSALKQKVIQALKNASHKSHSLYLKMSDRTAAKSPSLSRANEQENQEKKDSKPEKIRRPQSQQLARLLASHLKKHDGSSEQLNQCLKELHQYLKNQNDEIKQLKSFRDSQMNSTSKENKSEIDIKGASPREQPAQNKREPSRSPSPIQEYKSPPKSRSPSPVQEQKAPSRSQSPIQARMSPNTKKRKQMKLQQAILKNLKKARLRGSKFKERVENFKKAHQSQPNQNKNSDEKPANTQQNSNPQGENPPVQKAPQKAPEKSPQKTASPSQQPAPSQQPPPAPASNTKPEPVATTKDQPAKQGP